FFFSSRRRHTRSKRDWSSDVCSSDLCLVPYLVFLFVLGRIAFLVGYMIHPKHRVYGVMMTLHGTKRCLNTLRKIVSLLNTLRIRSEERRVGKECREWG